MAAASFTIAEVNRRRRTAEGDGRIEAETLAEIGRRISSSLELDLVLQMVAESAQSLVRSDGGQVGLVDDSGAVTIASVSGRRSAEPLRLVIPPGKGVAGWALATGKPQQSEDYHDEPAIERDATLDRISGSEGDVSVVALPILGGGTAVGVLWVLSRTRRRFNQREVSVLERLASHAAIAITNARIHAEEQETRAAVEALLSATASLSTQAEPEAVLRTLVEHAVALLEADRAIYAVVRDRRLVIPAEWQRGNWLEREHEASKGLVRLVWDTRRPYRTNEVQTDPWVDRERAIQLQIRQQLTVPLLGPGNERLGIVSIVNSRRPGGFGARDERLLIAICETGSAVLAREQEVAARTEAEATAARRKEEVEALLAVAEQLGSAVEPGEVLRRVVEIAARLTNAGRVGIATNEGDHAMRRHTWLDGEWHSLDTPMPLDGSVSGWVIQNRRPLRTDNLRSGPEVYPPATLGRLPATALAVPILSSSGDVLGSLNLFDRRDGKPFSDDDQRLVEGIAHHAAVALERAGFTLRLQEMADALKTTAQFNEAVIANASQGIVVYDRDLHYVVFNPFMEKLTGLSAEEVLGRAAHEVFPHLQTQGVTSLIHRALDGETLTTGDVHYEIPHTNRSGWSVSTFTPQRGPDGAVTGVIGSVNDVTARKEMEERLSHQAFFDQLTGLPNRASFMERLVQALESNGEDGILSVLFLDLDAFKLVNDTLGHSAGDELLVLVAERLRRVQQGSGRMVARFGGDEFAILVEDLTETSEAIQIAERILSELREPLVVNEYRLAMTTSVGIAFRTGRASEGAAMNLLREADIALYEAKATGKARAVVFSSRMNAIASERLELQNDLREAMDGNQLRLHYQPIVELATGAIVGTEVLLRWRHPERGFLEAKGFVQFLEKSELMLPVGSWALREACRQARSWEELRPDHPPFLMSVNVSSRQLEQPDFVSDLSAMLTESGLSPQRLELELTESALMEHPESSMIALKCVKELGVRLAIDDFGTGYSSLEYVARFAPDRVKIDQSFIRRLPYDRSAAAIVQAIMSLSNALALDTTAEGIETAEQLNLLRDVGCRCGQGYFFSRPVPRRALTAALEAGSLPLP
jgi:diguanylate cyclase (GGDEF)-like protein/PAS domain S-box-containing protein